ncbi:hypothetical protein Ae201684_001289 [Aphanomyces euteiches]|uniref:Uncharacterized protein n=1 Tax=Aphanomyces euteiches TaxID=100861 RepID=A0A6G0XUL3_9STRA|nr:hypothetical protein Ae201684_001289 [Aphanomyces euteiches]
MIGVLDCFLDALQGFCEGPIRNNPPQDLIKAKGSGHVRDNFLVSVFLHVSFQHDRDVFLQVGRWLPRIFNLFKATPADQDLKGSCLRLEPAVDKMIDDMPVGIMSHMAEELLVHIQGLVGIKLQPTCVSLAHDPSDQILDLKHPTRRGFDHLRRTAPGHIEL